MSERRKEDNNFIAECEANQSRVTGTMSFIESFMKSIMATVQALSDKVASQENEHEKIVAEQEKIRKDQDRMFSRLNDVEDSIESGFNESREKRKATDEKLDSILDSQLRSKKVIDRIKNASVVFTVITILTILFGAEKVQSVIDISRGKVEAAAARKAGKNP